MQADPKYTFWFKNPISNKKFKIICFIVYTLAATLVALCLNPTRTWMYIHNYSPFPSPLFQSKVGHSLIRQVATLLSPKMNCMHYDVTRQCIGRGTKYLKSRVILLCACECGCTCMCKPACVCSLKLFWWKTQLGRMEVTLILSFAASMSGKHVKKTSNRYQIVFVAKILPSLL